MLHAHSFSRFAPAPSRREPMSYTLHSFSRYAPAFSRRKPVNFTATQLHFRVSENFTNRKKERTFRFFPICSLFLLVYGFGLSPYLCLTGQMRCSHLSAVFKFSDKNISLFGTVSLVLYKLRRCFPFDLPLFRFNLKLLYSRLK